MCKELIEMINEGRIDANQFFTMNPFTPAGNTTFNEVGQGVNFFDDINLISNKTFERLAVLAKISRNRVLNTLIITGYRGSGKTNFLRFCEAVINRKTDIKDYNKVYEEHERLCSNDFVSSQDEDTGEDPDFFDERENSVSINDQKRLKRYFNISLSRIRESLESEFKYKRDEEIQNEIAAYLNSRIRGVSIYIDFNKGKRDSITPLQLKLTRHIEEHIKVLSPINISDLYDFYEINSYKFTLAFENRSRYFFEEAITFIYRKRYSPFDGYKDELLDCLRRLQIDQLLALEILLELTGTLNQEIEGNIYYFLDNLDMISGQENKTLVDTITEFWKFTEEMQSFVDSLRKDCNNSENNRRWINVYSKVVYIFAMRETTAMHIGDHLRGEIQQYAEHFDMSSDVNKSFIIKKRYNLVKKYIEDGQITNKIFIDSIKTIEAITEDRYYRWSLSPLFNDDYRTVINCLYQICKEGDNLKILHDESEPLLGRKENYMKFGGRGIIIKILCDSFRGWGYFDDLKIGKPATAAGDSEYNITMIRMILIVLQNLQKRRTGNEEFRFFVEREQSVSIKSLYEKVSFFCSKEMFIECIEKMFSIRNMNYWNHLITFDNMLEYSEIDIGQAMNGQKDIYVRCTEVGQMYLKILCVHYEFFSSRNLSNSKGLFCEVNYRVLKTRRNNYKYLFESLIKDVYDKVALCCQELYSFNQELLKKIGGKSYHDLIMSEYVKDGKLHEERIIHNHISYLDAFRLYLINGPLYEDTKYVNEKLIGYISNYLSLLKDKNGTFYSNNSERLFSELSGCIKIIKNIYGYDDRNTIISREYYEEVKDRYSLDY